MKIAALVPVKLNSRRLPNKNFLNLGGAPLASYIFEVLTSIIEIDSVYCYTSQKQIMSFFNDKVSLLPRPNYLDGDNVLGNVLFGYAVNQLFDYDVIIICHPTSPFVSAESISKGLQAVCSGEHDSAFSVEKHSTYAWFKNSPLNYDPVNMAQTQGLESIYLETSGFYIFKRSIYLERGSRIGRNPLMIEINKKEAIDIDYPEDFMFAEHMLSYSLARSPKNFDKFFIDLASSTGFPSNVLHVSFDFDGVLIDSIECMKAAWFDVCSELKIDIPFSDYKKHIGIPLRDILRTISVPEDLIDDAFHLYIKYSKTHEDKVSVVDGMIDLLHDLKSAGVKISIVTSKPKVRALSLINNFFYPSLLDILVTPEDIQSGRGKPSPDSLLHACCTVGADPASSIYVGDMDVDRLAANRANMHFIHAAWGYEKLLRRDEVWFLESSAFIHYIRDLCFK